MWSATAGWLARTRTGRSRALGASAAASPIPQSPPITGASVKRTGDWEIVEFRSVVDAVRCAIEVQNAMVERNSGVPEDRRIDFRIGIGRRGRVALYIKQVEADSAAGIVDHLNHWNRWTRLLLMGKY
jgi:hypothetical protein